MKLITKELMKKTPPLRAQANVGLENLKFYIKLFTPWTHWTWYIAEADFETGDCFGLVEGFETELGYFNLNEISAIRGPVGLKIERDKWFNTITYSELKQKGAL